MIEWEKEKEIVSERGKEKEWDREKIEKCINQEEKLRHLKYMKEKKENPPIERAKHQTDHE